MEAILKIAAGACIGTSLMTLFSYLLSGLLNKQFREPVLLNSFLKRLRFTNPENIPAVSGWIIHYSIGTIFVLVYHLVWITTMLSPNILSGSLLGFTNGLVGMAGWALVFRIHPNPPSIDNKAHYLHLLFAHILFGISATGGYLLI